MAQEQNQQQGPEHDQEQGQEQAAPSGPDLTKGVAFADFVDGKLLGHVGSEEVLLIGSGAGPAGVAIAGFPRQALHARLLGFIHPVTGERLSFASPMPADMAGLLVNLELL